MASDHVNDARAVLLGVLNARRKPGDLRRPGDGELLEAIAAVLDALADYVTAGGHDAGTP